MRWKDFEQDAFLMATITAKTLAQAQREEQAGIPFSSAAIHTLRRHLYGTAGRVQGMNQARQSMRSQIWSTVLVHGPPSLWVTINLSDLHDPIAQVFAGEHIDLDNLLNTPGPDVKQRAINIVADSYTAAKFFHFLITTIFKTLFGIHVTSHTITCNTSILGQLAAYLGAVESQARAALHQHCIIWLKNTPSSDKMLRLLKNASFRDKVIAFIQRNVCAYLPGLESAESVAAIPVEKDIAYNRPLNPAAQDYEVTVWQFKLHLVWSEQIHSCKLGRCLKSDRYGLLQCKWRAPFAISTEDFVNESGEWGAKHLYEYVNGWNPAVLVNARCNNDIKLLTNGEETHKVSFYVSGYAFKKQNVISNLSAIMADGFAYYMSHPKPEYVHEVQEQQRLLLFCLVNAINREQKLAAPIVMSYLIGWGDIKHSHMYTPVYWSLFVGALRRHHPHLHTMTRLRWTSALQRDQPYSTVEGAAAGDKNLHNVITSESLAEDADHEELVEAFAAEDGNERVTLEMNTEGWLSTHSQPEDYRLRGAELENMNVFDFFMHMYKQVAAEVDQHRDFQQAVPDIHYDDGQDEIVDDDVYEEPEDMGLEGLLTLKASQVFWKEYLHGRVVIKIAKHVNIFPVSTQPWRVHHQGGR
ncbi:hypothetical protein OBBRIDRAFT_832024 [Obba rivulosa]|uniref:Helitron helicase-like domain-containing protein n=1 Tax=Obba rivulosa TaxID=1052685 RepID=A0A8E2DR83_9APHY|nr:hypothetical protein OBBRIDRAFT_832024 [Obba rivulosa]